MKMFWWYVVVWVLWIGDSCKQYNELWKLNEWLSLKNEQFVSVCMKCVSPDYITIIQVQQNKRAIKCTENSRWKRVCWESITKIVYKRVQLVPLLFARENLWVHESCYLENESRQDDCNTWWVNNYLVEVKYLFWKIFNNLSDLCWWDRGSFVRCAMGKAQRSELKHNKYHLSWLFHLLKCSFFVCQIDSNEQCCNALIEIIDAFGFLWT